jgi:hypothetical protein
MNTFNVHTANKHHYVDINKPVWRVEFADEKSRRNTRFLNATSKVQAYSFAWTFNDVAIFIDAWEIDPETGYRR